MSKYSIETLKFVETSEPDKVAEYIADLEAKLEEKDAEIEKVKKSKTYIMNFGDKVKEVHIKEDNQDKIDFAVAELEKVRETLHKSNESGYIIQFSSMSDREKFNQVLDQQIKELKELK